ASYAFQRAVAQPLAKQLEQVSDGRAGTEAEDHAVFDPLERALGRPPLQRFTVAHDAPAIGRASARPVGVASRSGRRAMRRRLARTVASPLEHSPHAGDDLV